MNDYRNSFQSYSFNLSDFPPPFGIPCCAIVKRPQCLPQRTISNHISCINAESDKGCGDYLFCTYNVPHTVPSI